MKILLIAGHGSGDPGACAFDLQEANLTRDVVTHLKPLIGKLATVDVFDTNKNMYAYLKSGKAFDFKKYDYVLEVHFNACVKDLQGNGKTTGSEILIHPTEAGYSVESAILSNLQALGYTNRGVKRRSDLLNMNTVKGKNGISYALIEVCFIDDKDDITLYQKNFNKTVEAIANGIISGFNLAKTTATDVEPEPVADVPWYNDAQWWVKENGISDGTRPEEPTTRAEVWQMLYKAANIKK